MNTGRSDDHLCRIVAGLRLGQLADVRLRLLPRLVQRRRAGPLAISLGGAVPLMADVGIDVGDGIVPIDHGLASAWGVDRSAIWALARSNLASRPDPPWALVDDDPCRLRLVTDGAWTTGWLLLGHRLATRPAAMVAVAVADDLLVVADRPDGPSGPGQGPGGPTPAGPAPVDPLLSPVDPLAALLDPLLGLVGRLRGCRPDAWPPVPLHVRPPVPFPTALILE